MGFPGGWELIAILGVLVLLFGATKLPTAARSIGQSMRIFKAEAKGLRSDEDTAEETTAQGGQRPASQAAQAPPPALPPLGTPVVRTPAEELQRRDTSR